METNNPKDKTTILVSMDVDLKIKLRTYARQELRSVNNAICHILKLYLDEYFQDQDDVDNKNVN